MHEDPRATKHKIGVLPSTSSKTIGWITLLFQAVHVLDYSLPLEYRPPGFQRLRHRVPSRNVEHVLSLYLAVPLLVSNRLTFGQQMANYVAYTK